MTSSRRFKPLRKLCHSIYHALAKVPRALKSVRPGVKRRSRNALHIVSSMYEVNHFGNPFRPVYSSDDRHLDSLPLSASTTITMASDLSSTTLDGVELDAENTSNQAVKFTNIKTFGRDDEFTTSAQPATFAVGKDVSIDGRKLEDPPRPTIPVSSVEDDDNYEKLLARVSTMDKDERHMFDTNQLAMGKKRSAEVSVTVEPIEEEGEAAEDENLTVEDMDDDVECDRSIQRVKVTYQDLRTTRTSLRHPSDSNKLSLCPTSHFDTAAIHRDAIKERYRARSRASALSLVHLREDTPFCFANCDLVHDRPAVLAVLGRSSPLRNSYVKDEDDYEDEDEDDEEEALESMPIVSWSNIQDDEELGLLEDILACNGRSR